MAQKAAFSIRPATPDAVPDIQPIYAHHVRHGLASFEEQAPDLAEMTQRFDAVQAAGLPWLVAILDSGEIIGYAYASNYRSRPAYRFSLENSVYIKPGFEGQGAGRRLLDALMDQCAERGYRQMIAIIGDSENVASIALHRSAGFVQTGILEAVGFKHGRWVDSVLMQKTLGSGANTLPESN